MGRASPPLIIVPRVLGLPVRPAEEWVSSRSALRTALNISSLKRLIYVDYMPGHIAAWDPGAEVLLRRDYTCDEVMRAELAAIELGLELLDGSCGLILSDSIGAVKLVHGKSPRPGTPPGQWTRLLDTAEAIRSTTGESVIAWIPRKSNAADRALRRAISGE